MRIVTTLLGLLAGLCMTPYSRAATLSWSTTAPSVDGADIANLNGVSADADNINSGDDEQTYIAGDRPQQGQTFTTGSNSGQGFTLSAITLQQVGYENTYWSVDDNWGSPFYIRVGTVNAGTFTALATETAPMVSTGITELDATGTQFGTGTGAYLTLALDTPLELNDNTTYAISVESNGPFLELNGDGTTDANYTGGNTFTLPRGATSGTISTYSGDRVFHINLEADSSGPEPSTPDPIHPTTEPLSIVDLSGIWDFDPNNGPATTIQVPGGGWYKQGFTDTSEADYTTTISIPDSGQPQVTVLKFGAINYQADLFIGEPGSEQFVKQLTQSHTAAHFDITDFVTPGESYRIRLHVKGSGAMRNPATGQTIIPDGARSWAHFLPEGIFRSAEILIYPQVFIQDVFVKPSVEDTSLSYDVWIRNDSASTADVTLAGSLGSWNSDSWSYPSLPNQAVSIPANTVSKVTIGPINWNLGPDSYWWPNVPYEAGYTAQLHELDLSISGGGAHSTSVRFGFRECRQVSPDASHTIYTLNGIRVNFRGDSFQGANYDRIDTNGAARGGQSDAFSNLPGFLPPSADNPGWPKAVDNFQRLNYNVVRIHQIPATPYMLDVCDEMGLMIIDETGIRGSSGRQDFVTGYEYMIQHARDLFEQNRNHPSIVRSSLSNEPDHAGGAPGFQEQFHEDLYAAAKAVDGTRPLSIDSAHYDYNDLTYDDLSVFNHYGQSNNAYGQYTEDVFERPDRPYGSGEHIWYADNTAQGFAWFATSTQAMRAKGASDIRPYTLLSAWSSVIPGTETHQMQLENPPWIPDDFFPLYGEDNLPDPWSNAHIQRVQAGFNPVLVADVDYWEANKMSNAEGNWPANIPFLNAGESVTRTLNIYNDTFSGTAVDVFWELRLNSPTGALADSGVINATVPMGYMINEDITFTTPEGTDGMVYLVLYTEKDGEEIFRETEQRFQILNLVALSGTAFGTSPSWSEGTEFDKATDGNLETYFDYQNANGAITGIDLGAGNATQIFSIAYTPRPGFEGRMVGGQFQGSNDGTNYTTFHTVTEQPGPETFVEVNTSEAYRYLRYLAPDGSYGNIAEMTFYVQAEPALSALEEWRQTWYETTDNSGDAGDDADPHKTGIPNLVTYALFGPSQNPATARVADLPQPEQAGDYFEYSFTEPDGVSGVTYGAEWRPDLSLGNWQPVADSGSGTTHTFRVLIDDQESIFLRLTFTSSI